MPFGRCITRLAAISMLITAGAWSQKAPPQSIRGVLLDPMDRPVPSAPVTLDGGGQQISTLTSASGEFQFDNLGPGRYRLHVTVSGFKPMDRTVQVGSRPVWLVLKLALAPLKQQVTVASEALRVSTEAGANLNAIVG